jgi:diguanylate cyclase (GGDEF)-like protein
MRTSSFAYAFLFCGLYLWQGAYPVGFWVFSVLQFLVYPHLAYRRALRAKDTQKAELDNLLLDNVFFGLWVAALGFPLWISFTLFITSAINCAINLGQAGLVKSLAISLCGVLLGIAVFGLPGASSESPMVTALCVMGVSGYLFSLGHIAFRRTLSLRKLREKLKQNESDLQHANDVLRSRLAEIQLLQAQLHEQVNRDSLTGLFNRRYLLETVDRELARCQREGLPLTLMIIDVDHFKAINDKYGHNAGDEVLRQLASVLIDGTRQDDLPCRYGGEEFILLLPGMSTEIALKRGERLRANFEKVLVPSAHGDIRATISVGIASFPDHGATMADLTHCADLALYAVKRNGRNGVIAHSADISQQALCGSVDV